MQVEYVKLGSWITVRHYDSLITREEIEPIYFNSLMNEGWIDSSRIDYRQQIRTAKAISRLTKVPDQESAEGSIARSKLRLFHSVTTVWEPQSDKLITSFMLNYGAGRDEPITRLQAEIFSYVVYPSPFMKRDRKRIDRIERQFSRLSPKARNRPIEVGSRDVGLLITIDAYSFLLNYEPIWEEFIKFIPGRTVVVT